MSQKEQGQDVLEDMRGLTLNEVNRAVILQRHWPVSWLDSTPGISGLHCFTVVLRHIFSHLDKTMLDELKSSEQTNPLFGFVWMLFSVRDTSSKFQQAAKSSEVLKSLQERVACDRLNFHRLAESNLLMESIWKLGVFHLFRPALYKYSDESEWKLMPDTDEDVGRRSLVEWKLDETQSVSEAINSRFGIFENDEGAEILYESRCPVVIRVLFTPAATQSDMTIQDIRVAHVRHVHRAQKPDRDLRPMMGLQYKPYSSQQKYQLIAVVRLQGNKVEKDFVRLYSMDGVSIQPFGPPREYVSSGWKVEDQDHQLMLYYVRGDAPIADVEYPEMNQPQKDSSQIAAVYAGIMADSKTFFPDHGPSGKDPSSKHLLSGQLPAQPGDPKRQKLDKPSTSSKAPKTQQSQQTLPQARKSLAKRRVVPNFSRGRPSGGSTHDSTAASPGALLSMLIGQSPFGLPESETSQDQSSQQRQSGNNRPDDRRREDEERDDSFLYTPPSGPTGRGTYHHSSRTYSGRGDDRGRGGRNNNQRGSFNGKES